MTVKSIVEVDVDTAQFDKFSAAFEKYSGLLAKMPGAWAGVNKEMKTSFEQVAAALLAQNEVSDHLDKQAKSNKNKIKETETVWSKIAKSTKLVAGNVKDTTVSLLKWAALGGTISGLVGSGAVFGLDLIAANVAQGRKSSKGLGVSIGEQRGFSTSFDRLLDSPDSFLANINTALHDIKSRRPLYTAGLSDSDLRSNNPAQIGMKLLEKYKVLADRSDPSLDAQTMHVSGADQLLSLQDWQRLRNSDISELKKLFSNYPENVRQANIQDKDALAWQNFYTRLSAAGKHIEQVFVTDLATWIPTLDLLVKGAAATADTLFGPDGVYKHLIKPVVNPDKNSSWWSDFLERRPANMTHDEWVAFQKKANSDAALPKAGVTSSHPASAASNFAPWISAIAKVESDDGKYTLSSKGARGVYQLMPATAAQYGVNPDDPVQAKKAATALLTSLVKHYAGNIEQALAAYNWGQGNVDRDIKTYGASWKRHLPKETSGYIAKIEIYNATGANTIIASNQVK